MGMTDRFRCSRVRAQEGAAAADAGVAAVSTPAASKYLPDDIQFEVLNHVIATSGLFASGQGTAQDPDAAGGLLR